MLRARKVKTQKIRSQNEKNGDDFTVAFVIEKYGAVGKEARMLLKEVSELIEERKRNDYMESAVHSNKYILRTSKRERGAMGGGNKLANQV